MVVSVRCPACAATLDGPPWDCASCGRSYRGGRAYVDLLGEETQTAEHYSLQWGETLAFLDFVRSTPGANEVLASAQLGWSRLFDEIRAAGAVRVYDAACGFGAVAAELARADTAAVYVGADVHDALERIVTDVPALAERGLIVRWDVTRPLPVDEPFDYVICRAALHHTPDPERTLDVLLESLALGGTIAISVYRRKARTREAVDEALRSEIAKLSPTEAFAVSRDFALLGRALQQIDGSVRIDEDLEFLGIRAGEYAVQELVYDHLLKCFWNDVFGERYSTLVNYDWYHPEFAHRFDAAGVRTWLERRGLEVVELESSKAQHYAVARRR